MKLKGTSSVRQMWHLNGRDKYSTLLSLKPNFIQTLIMSAFCFMSMSYLDVESNGMKTLQDFKI